MNLRKKFAVLPILILLIPVICLQGFAAVTGIGVQVTAPAEPVEAGETVTVTVALTGYGEGADSIQAMQVDVDKLDSNVLEVVSQESTIADNEALYNKAVYQPENQRLRLIYARVDGRLSAPCEEVFRFDVKVRETVTTSGTVTMPVTVKLGNTDETATLTTECQLNYCVKPSATDAVYLYHNGTDVTGKTITFDVNQESPQLQLNAKAAPSDARQSFSWSSSNESIATVDGEGCVSFSNTVGTVKITAKATDGTGKAATVTIKTVKVPQKIEAQNPQQTLLAGKSTTLKVYDADGKAINAKQLTWSLEAFDSEGNAMDAAPYASINASGKLTAKQVARKVRVIATGRMVNNTDVSVKYTVDIYPAVTQIDLLDGVNWLNGKTVQFNLADPAAMTIEASLYPEDSSPVAVKWTVSDKKGAYVTYTNDDNCLTLTPTGKNGTVTIKAEAQDGSKKNASFKLQLGTFATDLTLPEGDLEVVSGKKLQLNATTQPENPTKPGVSWKLKNKSDSAYASISASGLLTAKKVAGIHKVTLVVSSKDGAVTKECEVTIRPAEGTLMLLRGDTGAYVTRTTQVLDWNAEGTKLQLKAQLGTDTPAEGVTWKSSNERIATVKDGLVTFLKSGKVTISATVAGVPKESVTLNCISLVDRISIGTKDGKNMETTDDSVTIHAVSGKSIALKAETNPEAANRKVTWSIVSGAEFGKLSASGALTPVKDLAVAQEMTVRATAADGSGFFAEATVTIHPMAQSVQIYSIHNGIATLRAETQNWWFLSNTDYTWDLTTMGDSVTLSAEVYPYYGADDSRNALQTVTWKSSNPKIAQIGTSEEDGSVQVICNKTGTVTITATAADGSNRKASFKLKIVKNIKSMELEDQTVAGGKSLDLAKLLKIDPTGTTTKNMKWEIISGEGSTYATISTKGVLKAKKVTKERTVTIRVTAQDDWKASAECTVTICP